MPLKGYVSRCDEHAEIIISKDERNPQRHVGVNKQKMTVTHYKIDGEVIKFGERCDYLLLNEDLKRAYFIELKGSDLVKAAKQIEKTEAALRDQLKGYSLNYRIVANRCKTQEIETSEFKRYKLKWGKKLRYQSRELVDNIDEKMSKMH